MLNIKEQFQSAGERGIALLEFTVSLPFLLILTIGIVDIGLGLREYFNLRNAVASGTERAESIPELPVNTQYSTGSTATCPTNADPRHQEIHRRIADVMVLQSSSLKELCIQSMRVGPGSSQESNTVLVTATGTYDAIFPLFDKMILTASARVNYPF